MVYKYIVYEDENGNLITKVVSESPKPFFQYRIQQREIDFSQEPHTAEERRILEAYYFFEEHLREDNLKKDISKRFGGVEFNYIDLLKLIRDQILNCKVIYVTVAEFSEAYEIFEVLNAKGKNLDPIDIIKNNLFSMLQQTKPIDRAQEKWMQIKNNITEGDVDDIQTFYRHYWISKYSKSTSKNLVREFDKLIPKTSERYEAFMMELVEASKDYMRLTKPLPQQWTQPEDREIYNALNALNIFGVTQPRSFILALLDARRRDIINHKKLLEIINFIQYFHFVFTAVCSARPSGLEAKYSKYARLLRQCTTKQESAEYVNCLKGELSAILPTYYPV